MLGFFFLVVIVVVVVVVVVGVLCFVGGIFRFANFIFGFAIFGICWILCVCVCVCVCIDWFVRSWHYFGWQENAVIIFIYFWVRYMYIL